MIHGSRDSQGHENDTHDRGRRLVLLLAGGLLAAVVAAYAGHALRRRFGAADAPEVPGARLAVTVVSPPAVESPTGRLAVRVNPAGAMVRIGGLAYVAAPLTLDALPAGRHRVVITHPGYLDWQGEVEVTAGREATVAVELFRSYGILAVISDPPNLAYELGGNGVFQKGKADGKAIRVPTGRYELIVRRARYPELRRPVVVRNDAVSTEQVSLVGGRVEIDSIPAGASVFEGDVLLGATPYVGVEVPRGEHRFELRLKDHGSVQRVVRVEERGSVQTSVALAKFVGPIEGLPWRVPGLEADLVWLRAGIVTVGSPGAVNADTMLATLSTGYWLGATEVTQRQWQELMPSSPSLVKGDDLPVDRVSWERAMDYCRRLTERESAAGRLPDGYEYTLPSEVQWEYACRAGMGRINENTLDQYAWYRANAGGKLHAVRMKKANAWGLHDMLGNVAEFCRDAFTENRPKKAIDFVGGQSVDRPAPAGQRRTYHGGHCDDLGVYVTPYHRQTLDPSTGWENVGFRLALVRKIATGQGEHR